jgi:hypothetical protein
VLTVLGAMSSSTAAYGAVELEEPQQLGAGSRHVAVRVLDVHRVEVRLRKVLPPPVAADSRYAKHDDALCSRGGTSSSPTSEASPP